METKPHWMTLHEQSDNTQFAGLKEDIAELKEMLAPIVSTYETIDKIGRWGKIGAGTLLLGLSIAIAVRTLFKI